MKKFKYVGAQPEVDVPALGLLGVTRNQVVEVHDSEVIAGMDGHTDNWKHVPDPKRSRASKTAAKKAAAKTPEPDPAPEPETDNNSQEG